MKRSSLTKGYQNPKRKLEVTLLRYYGVFPCRLCSRNVCYVRYYVITGSFLAGFAQEMLVPLLRYYNHLSLPALLKNRLLRYYVITGSFLAGFAQEMLVMLLSYYRVFPCRLCSRNACYIITLLRGLSLPVLLKKCLLCYYVITGSFSAGFAQQSLVTLLRGLSLPALLNNRLLRYYVITRSFLAGFAQQSLVTLLRCYGVFPCRLCSTIACYVITLLRSLSLPALLNNRLLCYYVITESFLAGFAQQSLVTLLRYYGVFPCRLCSTIACYVITLLRGLSLPALLNSRLLCYYVITESFLAGFAQQSLVTLLRSLSLPALLNNRLLRYYVITESFLAGFAQQSLVTLLRYYGVFPCRLCSTIACYVITLLRSLSLPALLNNRLLCYYAITESFLAGFAQQSLVMLLRYSESFLAGFAQQSLVTLLRYYGVFPCRLCSTIACYIITLLRSLSLPALLNNRLLCYYVIAGSFLAGFAQQSLVTLLRYYGVFPCRLCSRNACYIITLLYGVFPCRLCSTIATKPTCLICTLNLNTYSVTEDWDDTPTNTFRLYMP